MRRLLEQAGFTGDNAGRFVQHIYLSGGFNEPLFSALCHRIGMTERNKSLFQTAITDSTSPEGNFDTGNFLDGTARLPLTDSWAYIQASMQRFFQDQVVVSLQQPTDYSETNRDAILKLADDMGLRESHQIAAGSVIHYGVCFGATSGAAHDYLLRHKKIFDERSNKDDPYTLFMFCGTRILGDSDNQVNFTYGKAGQRHDYLTYLSKKYKVPRGRLTEGLMMRDRYQAIWGDIPHLVRIEGSDTIKDTAAFMGHVAEILHYKLHEEGKRLALTSYDIFNRTYTVMMQTALEQHGLARMVAVECDGGRSGSRDKPQTLMRELAKIIHTQYEEVAVKCGFVAHEQSRFSAKAIKEMEEGLRRATESNDSYELSHVQAQAAKNNRVSQFRLAMLYHFGIGANGNDRTADIVRLLGDSAKQDYMPAKAMLLALGKYQAVFPEVGSRQREHETLLTVEFLWRHIDSNSEYTIKSASGKKLGTITGPDYPAMHPSENIADSALVLGYAHRMYERHLTGIEPYRTAEYFYAQAVNFGSAFGRTALTQNASELQLAAQQGYAVAQYKEGIHLEELDPIAAFRNYQKAAAQQYLPAMKAMVRCYKLGIGTKPDSVRAREWHRLVRKNTIRSSMEVAKDTYSDALSSCSAALSSVVPKRTVLATNESTPLLGNDTPSAIHRSSSSLFSLPIFARYRGR